MHKHAEVLFMPFVFGPVFCLVFCALGFVL